MTSAIRAPNRYVMMTPGPASRIVTVLPRKSPTPMALPMAIMAIWRGTSARFSPSSAGCTGTAAYPDSEGQSHFAVFLLDLVHRDLLLRRPALDLAGRDVELRSVPEALHRAADHHSARQRSPAVRARIVEGDIAVVGTSEHDPLPADVEQLHLIDLQLVDRGDDGCVALARVDRRLAPLARLRVPVIDADQVARDERASQVAADAEQHKANRLETEDDRVRLDGRSAAHPRRAGEQRHHGQNREHVLRRAVLGRAFRRHRVEVVDHAGDSRRQRGRDAQEAEVTARRPPRWHVARSEE